MTDVENPNKKHYVAVKSLSRLLSKQNSKHKEAQHFCSNCLNGFESEIIRDEHCEYCRSKDSVRVEMPTKDPIGRSENKNMMQFSSLENEIRPGVVHTLQEFLFTEVKIFVLIDQGGHISPSYRLKKEELAMNRKNVRRSLALQV